MKTVSNDFYRQFEELTVENEKLNIENRRLREENRELRIENRRLCERISALEASIDERISKAVADAVAKATEPLYVQIAKKDEEICRLKAIIDKDSSNSSKPPSSNGFKSIPNNREKSDKKQGGQNGHKGSTILIPKNLPELVAAGKAEHKIVYEIGETMPYISDWVVDLKMVPVYTEIRRAIGNPPTIKYGDGMKSVSTYLSVIGLISVSRLSEFFREVSGGMLTVAKATLQEFTREAGQNVDTESIKTDLLNGAVMNVDETPVKTTEKINIDGTTESLEKTTINAYIRTYSNSLATLLTPNAHKDIKSVENDDILPRFQGIVIQDFEAKFLRYGTATGLCGAHLSRELKGLAELEKISWANDVRQFFREMNDRKNTDMSINTTSCDEESLTMYENRYDELVASGRVYLCALKPNSYARKALAPIIKRLGERKSEYMFFMRDYGVAYTNNLAERDLRHCKTKQKISGCYRSWQGLVDYCNIRSAVETARKRGENLLECIMGLFKKPCPAGQ